MACYIVYDHRNVFKLIVLNKFRVMRCTKVNELNYDDYVRFINSMSNMHSVNKDIRLAKTRCSEMR